MLRTGHRCGVAGRRAGAE